MPVMSDPIQEIGNRFIDPISKQIIYGLLGKLDLMEYMDGSIYINSNRTAISVFTDSDGAPNVCPNRCDVDLTCSYTADSQEFQGTQSIYNTPSEPLSRLWLSGYRDLFLDREAKFSVKEFTTPFSMAMDIELKFQTYDGAQRAVARLLSMQTGSMLAEVHDLVYDYPISPNVFNLIQLVYKAKQTSPTVPFGDYLKSIARVAVHRSVRKGDVGDTDAQVELVIRRHQLNCMAKLSFDQADIEAEKFNSVPEGFSVKFHYALQCGRPNMFLVDMPIMVDNVAFPPGLFTPPEESYIPSLKGVMQNPDMSLGVTELLRKSIDPQIYIQYPEYDDWRVPPGSTANKYNYHEFFVAALILDTPSPVTTIDLNNLGNYHLSSFVKDLLKQHTTTDVFQFRGLFSIQVYQDNLPVHPSRLTWDPDNLIILLEAFSVSPIYRLVISEAYSIRVIDQKWLDVLPKYRYYFPLSIARNLDYLTQQRRPVYFSCPPEFLSYIRRLNQLCVMGNVISLMVSRGRCTRELYQFTQTPSQFADYVINNPAFTTKDYPRCDSLYDVFLDTCVELNYLTEQNKPQLSIANARRIPFGIDDGGINGFNAPVRVIQSVISV